MKRCNTLVLCVLVHSMCAGVLAAQEEPVSISYSGSRSYTLIERSDIRRYDGGRYTGLLSRETRAFISPQTAADGASSYSGNFFVLEQTKSNGRSTAKGIDAVVPVVFKIDASGNMTVSSESPYPEYRSFPSFPDKPVKPGDSWIGSAERCVDPLGTGQFTRIPILVEYRYIGEETYKGEEAYHIRAKWATRYGNMTGGSFDPGGDPALMRASGTHDADIMVRKSTGETIVIRDVMDETFLYQGGQTVAFKGSSVFFTEYPPAINRGAILSALEQIATVSDEKGEFDPAGMGHTEAVSGTGGSAGTSTGGYGTGLADAGIDDAGIDDAGIIDAGEREEGTAGSGLSRSALESALAANSGGNTGVSGAASDVKNDIVVEETDAGLRLSVQNIRFQPDSDQILPQERSRLDDIARVLKLAGDAQFLIEGHTAAVGKPAGEQQLSVERARAIAKELAARGIDAERMMCTGYGGTRPIGDNSTDEGRAQNRRVEITILE